MKLPTLPHRIICLTEEAAELLYLLGEQDRIIGISAFALRPTGIKKNHPVVSVFTHTQIEKVGDLKPDLIIGYSDIQKDIARELIEKGHNVFISNHRSLQEVINYCATIASLVDANSRFEKIVERWLEKIEEAKRFARKLKEQGHSLKVYIEEWDEPRISGIHYFSELVELCGLEDINSHLRTGFLAKERFPDEKYIIDSDPDLILACWCGKKVDLDSFSQREGWSSLKSVRHKQIHELPPEIFLQPGPALFEEGIDYLIELIEKMTRSS